MSRPIVRYATTSDGLEIAYQVLGDGPLDVLIVPGVISNRDRNADYPFYGCYLRCFPRFARTIVLDKRGGECPIGSWEAAAREDERTTSGRSWTRSATNGQHSSGRLTGARSRYSSRPPIPTGSRRSC
jgi:hypothetical protein